jgi:pyruvate formate lyase activating enzyme
VPDNAASSARGQNDHLIIFDLKRYAIHDGPGIRTTVFFKGCPLRCLWCHNPEGFERQQQVVFHAERCIGCGQCKAVCPKTSEHEPCHACGSCVAVCPTEAREMLGQALTIDEVMGHIRKDVIFYDQSGGGVTFSGGEPLLQSEALLALLDECRKEDIHTAIETSGYADTATLLEVAELADLWLFDLKMMDPAKHRAFTGVGNELILTNLLTLAQAGANIRIRAPIIPGYNDNADSLLRLGKFVTQLPGQPPIDLLPYHGTATPKYYKLGLEYDCRDVSTPSAEHLQALASTLRKFGLSVKIGG